MNKLPFKPLSQDEMLAAPQAELETFLTQVYKSIASNATSRAEKVY